jgi:hypothetical protein
MCGADPTTAQNLSVVRLTSIAERSCANEQDNVGKIAILCRREICCHLIWKGGTITCTLGLSFLRVACEIRVPVGVYSLEKKVLGRLLLVKRAKSQKLNDFISCHAAPSIASFTAISRPQNPFLTFLQMKTRPIQRIYS